MSSAGAGRRASAIPIAAATGSPLAFASGGRKDPMEALEIAAIVEQTGRKMVYVQFGLPLR